MKTWVVMKREGDGSARFWAGSRWVPEFPDARLYPGMFPALEDAQRLADLEAREIEVALDYGSADPRVRVALPGKVWTAPRPRGLRPGFGQR